MWCSNYFGGDVSIPRVGMADADAATAELSNVLRQIDEGDHVRVTTDEVTFTGVVDEYFASDPAEKDESIVLNVVPDDYDALPLDGGFVTIAVNYRAARDRWSQDCHQGYEDPDAGEVVSTDIIPDEPDGETKRVGNAETAGLGRIEDVETV